MKQLIQPGQMPELVDIDSLQPMPGNARTQDVDELREGIRAYGFYSVLVVQYRSGSIIIGNHRWMAAKEEGIKQVLIYWVECDDETATRLNVWDNRIGDKGGYDPIARILQLETLAQSEMGLLNSGFDADEMAKYIADNEIPLSEEEPIEPDIPMGSGKKPFEVACPNCGEEFDAHEHRKNDNPF